MIIEWFLGPWLQVKYGLYLETPLFSGVELIYILVMMGLSLLISFIPAFSAMNSALKDGLSIKV